MLNTIEYFSCVLKLIWYIEEIILNVATLFSIPIAREVSILSSILTITDPNKNLAT